MSPGFSKNTVRIMALIAGLICFLVYWRALSCGFVNWDDGEYVYDNLIIRSLNKDFFVTTFTSSPLNFWIPLTWTSFAVEYSFWGLNPFGYHLTNILLHSVNAGIFLLVADRMWSECNWGNCIRNKEGNSTDLYLYPSMLLFAALLWGIHPARVESVAWITERKDVLNGLFTISSIFFYLSYVQKKETTARKIIFNRDYLFSLLLFLFSLMSKPTSVLLPIMLLAIDWYPLGRLQKKQLLAILYEKLPYLLIGAGVSVVTIKLNQQVQAYIPLSYFPLDARVVVIGNSLFEYFKFMLNPLGILPYHHLQMNIPQIFILKTIIIFCVILACLYIGRKKKWLAAIIFSFIIPLLPVLQFFPNGLQPALCLRYTYLPSLFPCIIIAGLLMSWFQRPDIQIKYIIAVRILLVVLLVFYAAVTYNHIGDWKNSETFWSKVIKYQPFGKAYYYRALFYVDAAKNYKAAVDDYTTGLEMFEQEKNGEIYNLYAFRGEALALAGNYSAAVKDFDVAISLFPHKLYYYYRGYALVELGRIKEAEHDLVRAGRENGRLRWLSRASSLKARDLVTER